MIRTIVFCGFIAFCATAYPMSFVIEEEGGTPYTLLTGKINSGDSEKFALYLAGLPKNNAGHTRVFRIESPGGDVKEAIRIGSIIRGLYGVITVKLDKYCASSCFLIWINGAHRFATYPDAPKTAGYLAVHRPYFTQIDGRTEGIESAGDRQVKAMKQMRGYLEENMIPRTLIDEMMSRPSNGAYVLSGNDLRMLGEVPPWFEEISIAKCGYRRDLVVATVSARVKGNETEANRLQEYDERVMECQADIAGEASLKFLERLRIGWRPWTKH